jgi:hypothetical protein
MPDTIAAHQRITILRHLSQAGAYHLNDSMLQDLVCEYSAPIGRDELRGMLAWLEEQRLLTLSAQADGVLMATLTDRGLDVANARISHPGVKRPSAGSIAKDALRASIGLKPEG